jgi:hypothetical protein
MNMTKKELILIANHYLGLIGSDRRVHPKCALNLGNDSFIFIKDGEELELFMKVRGDIAEVSIVPKYSVEVIGHDEFTGLKWSATSDFDSKVKDLQAYMNNSEISQSVKKIRLSPLGITEPLYDRFNKWTKGKEDKVLYWYT